MTGFGRTGRNFGIDHWDVCPDLIACGKGIAGGYSPLAAALIHERIWQVLERRASGATAVGYTHAANPLSAATSHAVLSYIANHRLVERSVRMGRTMIQMAKERLGHHPHVGDIRGKGLHMAVEFVCDKATCQSYSANVDKAGQIYATCMQEGLNLCPVHGDADGLCGDSLIIKPAFTLLVGELAELFDKFERALALVEW